MGLLTFFKNITGIDKPSVRTNFLSSFTSQVTQNVVSSVQRCLHSATFSQSTQLICNVPTSVATAFLNSSPCQSCFARNGFANVGGICDQFCRACSQTDINQSAVLVITQECQLDSLAAANIKNQINLALDAAITNREGALGQLADSIPDSSAVGTDDSNNIVSLRRSVKNLITQQNVQQLLDSISNNQSVTIVSNGGASRQGGITQNLLFYSSSQLVANNLQASGVQNDSSLTASQANPPTEDSGLSWTPVIIGCSIGAILLFAIIVWRYRQNSKKSEA